MGRLDLEILRHHRRGVGRWRSLRLPSDVRREMSAGCPSAMRSAMTLAVAASRLPPRPRSAMPHAGAYSFRRQFMQALNTTVKWTTGQIMVEAARHASPTRRRCCSIRRAGRARSRSAPTKPMATQRDLSLAYSPGVAVPVLRIAEDPDAAYDYTAKGNLVAVISNGTAILGPRQSRRARLQAGDGRQGGAVQALRRRRFHRPRGRHRGRRRVRQLRALSRPHLRRHQPRGHQGAGMLHHRAAPARADGHSRSSTTTSTAPRSSPPPA